jgi:hypothetical protein
VGLSPTAPIGERLSFVGAGFASWRLGVLALNRIPIPAASRFDATPLGLMNILIRYPRVARASQPWAERHYPVGVIALCMFSRGGSPRWPNFENMLPELKTDLPNARCVVAFANRP